MGIFSGLFKRRKTSIRDSSKARQSVEHSSENLEVLTHSDKKVCAICGAVAEPDTIMCSQCGRGVFQVEKTHREHITPEWTASAPKAKSYEIKRKGEIRIQCEGCGVIYILGKDSAVLTDAQLAGDMVSSSVFGGASSLVNSPERPDDVAHIKCSWDQWADAHRKQQQRAEIHRILTETSVQWWRCWECHRVQPYRIP